MSEIGSPRPRRGVGGLPSSTGAVLGSVVRAGGRFARRLPGGAAFENAAGGVAEAALAELGRGLDAATRVVREQRSHDDGAADPLRARMAQLLELAIERGRDGAARTLYDIVLRQLSPDEARILAALSDGTSFPLVHVARRSAAGGTGEYVLENASTVGKAAGVAVPENVPAYLGRLRAFGLVESGGQDETLAEEYDILLTDRLVVDAEDRARGERRLAPRIVRRTCRLSSFGGAFWRACDPTGGIGPS